jgi:hypothetical protein
VAVDELGDQYDPRVADSWLRHTFVASTNTALVVFNTGGGYWTMRTDEMAATDQKIGNIQVGAY